MVGHMQSNGTDNKLDIASKKAEALVAEERKRADSHWQKKHSELEREKDSALAAEAKRFASLQDGAFRSCCPTQYAFV